MDQSSIEAWPFDSTNRSRLGQMGSCGIEAHHAIPDRVNQRRERHGRARMSGFSLLDRIDRERSNGVDGQLDHIPLCG